MTPVQLRILHDRGTEPPFSGEYVDHFDDGVYACVQCGTQLFSSETKFESTTPGLIGWPAFADILQAEHIELREDRTFGMRRLELVCRTCGGHLGHYFDDDASPNGKHYCVNSACLRFEPASQPTDDSSGTPG